MSKKVLIRNLILPSERVCHARTRGAFGRASPRTQKAGRHLWRWFSRPCNRRCPWTGRGREHIASESCSRWCPNGPDSRLAFATTVWSASWWCSLAWRTRATAPDRSLRSLFGRSWDAPARLHCSASRRDHFGNSRLIDSCRIVSEMKLRGLTKDQRLALVFILVYKFNRRIFLISFLLTKYWMKKTFDAFELIRH